MSRTSDRSKRKFFATISRHVSQYTNKKNALSGIVPCEKVEVKARTPIITEAHRRKAEPTLQDKTSLEFLTRVWKKIKESFLVSSGTGISQAVFVKICKSELENSTTEDEELLKKLYARVDRRSRGIVQTVDITTAMVIICGNATRLQKLNLLFRIFGSDDDSCLTSDEIFDLYFTIRINDLTKDPTHAATDQLFGDELSLQEAKRFFERTVPMMSGMRDSEFVMFDEFMKVFEARPYLLEDLLPGSYSLDWVLRNTLEDTENGIGGRHADEVMSHFIKALRKGEEHLNLNSRRGRGRRIMFGIDLLTHKDLQDGRSMRPGGKKVGPAQFGRKSKLPMLESSRRVARIKGALLVLQPDEKNAKDGENVYCKRSGRSTCQAPIIDMYDESDSSEDDTPQHHIAMRRVEEKKTNYIIDDVQLPALEKLNPDHKNGAFFRSLGPIKVGARSLETRSLETRKIPFNCLVCGIQHTCFQAHHEAT